MDGIPERERRGSLGRAFMRFRDAIRRRSSSNRRTSIVPVSFTPGHTMPTDPTPAVLTEDTLEEPLKSAEGIAEMEGAPTVLTIVDLPLVPDSEDVIEPEDTTEPLLPMASNRTGLTDERARKLFEKYGIKYEPSNTEPQPTNDRRRVEKPIRIRVHWTCHDCNSSFGVSKTCTNCGHRRCAECPRSPAKRVKQILDTARQLRDEYDQPPAASGDQQTIMNAPAVAASPRNVLNTTPAETLQPDASEHNESTTPTDQIELAEYQHAVQHRPRHEMQLALQPKIQIIHRTFPGDHAKRVISTQRHLENERPLTEEPKTVATVQRVYRKPRMRVRWTCDQCQTKHGDSTGCRHCGHERCIDCTRDP